jgi:glucokinase
MNPDCIAAIDIGGTKIAVAIATLNGEIIARNSFQTNLENTPAAELDQALSLLEALRDRHQAHLLAAGIGCAGPLDFERGIVTAPPNLPLWREVPLRSFVEDRLGIPAMLDNDANAAVVGEHLYGAGRGLSDLIYLTISTGIGGGIIADHQLVHRWGEAGHVTVEPDGALCGCGGRGCLEALCSGTNIARRAREQVRAQPASMLNEMVPDPAQVSAQVVVAAARAGDELAMQVWRATIRYLAIGIGSLIAALAPQAVILGGGVAAGAGDFLLLPLRAELAARVHIVSLKRAQVLPAALGSDSALYGAIALGLKLARATAVR